MSTGDEHRGLYGKYRVERTDGKPVGQVFVLAYDTDPYARIALAAYAAACRKRYPYLARDLFARLGLITDGIATQARNDPADVGDDMRPVTEAIDPVALASFVFDTVGCDLCEYDVEPYSSLIGQCIRDDDSTPIGRALVEAYLDRLRDTTARNDPGENDLAIGDE